MMQRLLGISISAWLLAGCVSSAVITKSDRDRVVIRAKYPNVADVSAEANRGCAFYGRGAQQVSQRCADALCTEQVFEFSCHGRARYFGSRSGPWLGMSVDDIDDHLYADPPGTSEVVVRRVFVDGPAERAGLRVGDIVETFGGARVANAAMVVELKRSVLAGEDVSVGIRRGRDRFSATIAAEPWR
jgi:hypothetical protein